MIINEYEAQRRLVDEINKVAETSAIIVEGKNDKKALQQIGIKGEFYLIKQSYRGLEEAAENISKRYKKIIFMIDRDPAGRKLLKKLKQIFNKLGVKINESFMLRLLSLCDTVTVESVKPIV